MVIPHRKKRNLWYSLVESAVILAEVRREISNRSPIAEDNKTTRFVGWASDKAAGRYIEHHPRRSEAYLASDRQPLAVTGLPGFLPGGNGYRPLRAPLEVQHA